MSDPDLEMEQLLGRYGPAEPPADLKPRAIAAAYSAMRARRLAWAAVAAAVVAVALQWQVGRAYRAIGEPAIQAQEAERSEQVASMAEVFGGGDDAVRAATLIVDEFARAEVIPVAMRALEEWTR